ncbi:Cyclodipeptide synthase [Gracilaria domingensis]|nr:Cyclodipeptide synthase [Gracilaria domingensis]
MSYNLSTRAQRRPDFLVVFKMSDKDLQEGQREGLYFRFDFKEKMLRQPGVFVPVSVLAHSPLKEPHGSRGLVSLLQSLPYPSVVLMMDSINQHNIMVLNGVGAKGPISAEKALQMASNREDLYMEALSNAIKESNAANPNRIHLIRWETVNGEIKKTHEAIVYKYYSSDDVFRKRADEVALEFLNQRTPNSPYTSQRKTHAVKYVLGELAVCITGISYIGKRYQTLLYWKSTSTLAKMRADNSATMWKLAYDIFTDSSFSDLRRELIECCDSRSTAPVRTVL